MVFVTAAEVFVLVFQVGIKPILTVKLVHFCIICRWRNSSCCGLQNRTTRTSETSH